ncbi:major facilitator superfamily domain-containing protein [Lyophyllum atratum]|nr:major facilitator superfamily domain-containing protein [Lyophyllum atratum]
MQLPLLQRGPNTTSRDSSPQVLVESATEAPPDVDSELKLPQRASLVIMITANALLQISFFIIVSSSNEYALHLGGTSTFSGIVIGIPTVFSGLALLPLAKYDRGGYKIPLHISCAASLLGHILYALAYRFSFLYLILIGRIVSGFGFTLWMYCKRFCSDPRIVGVRRRTTLAAWLVVGQGLGISLGPVWNGFTAPGWVMAAVWAGFWVVVWRWYEDIPLEQRAFGTPLSTAVTPTTEQKRNSIALQQITVSPQTVQPPPDITQPPPYHMTPQQWGVVACMCWFAMTCFFILGAWESNLPVFGASTPPFHWSPTAAGNFIALGGVTTFPFLALNLGLARRTQDRQILALGTSLGLAALLTFLVLLRTGKLSYGAVFACWWAVALGFNMATTVTMSTLSKQLPPKWNGRTSLAIQYSNYTGRVAGAVWGGSGVVMGMRNYVGVQIALVGVGAVLFVGLWRDLKTKLG